MPSTAITAAAILVRWRFFTLSGVCDGCDAYCHLPCAGVLNSCNVAATVNDVSSGLGLMSGTVCGTAQGSCSYQGGWSNQATAVNVWATYGLLVSVIFSLLMLILMVQTARR